MTDTKVDFIISIGTDWSQDIELLDQHGQPLTLSNYTVVSKIKKHPSSRSYITINTAAIGGTLTLSLDAEATVNTLDGRYGYDVFLIDIANNHSKVLEGTVLFKPSISK